LIYCKIIFSAKIIHKKWVCNPLKREQIHGAYRIFPSEYRLIWVLEENSCIFYFTVIELLCNGARKRNRIHEATGVTMPQ
jgi:hypothetical protein